MEEKKIEAEDCVREEKSQPCGRPVGGAKPVRTERQAKAWNTMEKVARRTQFLPLLLHLVCGCLLVKADVDLGDMLFEGLRLV